MDRRQEARHGRLERVVLARVFLHRLTRQRAFCPLGVEGMREQMALFDHLVESVQQVHVLSLLECDAQPGGAQSAECSAKHA
jgi:hypothetical protein